MSQDGRLQPVPKPIINDRPIESQWKCECGGIVYASAKTRYARCTGGELRCLRCRRKARRFGKRGVTCGFGCSDA